MTTKQELLDQSQTVADALAVLRESIVALPDDPVEPPPPPPPPDDDPPPPPPPPPPVESPANEHEAAKLLAPAATATLFVPAGEVRELGSGEHVHGDIRAEGTLRLLPGCKLKVHTLSAWHGTFEIGSPENPVTLANPVEIIIRDMGPLDPATDPFQLGRGIIFHGKTRIYGESPATAAVDVPISEAANQVRAITIRSESAVNRGHVMSLHNQDFVIEGTAFLDLGRTRKDIPVTDFPNVGNLRGRYSFHVHHGGTTPGIQRGRFHGNYVARSPGLGVVIHDSAVEVTNNITFDHFGTHLFAESGSEVGEFSGNLCVKSTGVPAPSQLNDDLGNFDFGHRGHGIWAHGGGILIRNNVLSGHRSAIAVIDRPEGTTTFAIDNLPPNIRPFVDPAYVAGWTGLPLGQMPVQDVPLQLSGNKVYDSDIALDLYGLRNPSRHSAAVTTKSPIENEEYHGRVVLSYIGHTHLKNCKVIGNATGDVRSGFAISHSQRNFDFTYENCEIVGWEAGIQGATEGDNLILGGHFDCQRGIVIQQAHHENRKLHIDGTQTFGPRTQSGYSWELTGFRWDIARLYQPDAPEEFWRVFFQQPATDWRRLFETDHPTVGNEYFSPDECGPTFSFAPLVGLPADLRSHTTESARALGLFVLGRVLPADAVQKPGHRGWFHTLPVELRASEFSP